MASWEELPVEDAPTMLQSASAAEEEDGMDRASARIFVRGVCVFEWFGALGFRFSPIDVGRISLGLLFLVLKCYKALTQHRSLVRCPAASPALSPRTGKERVATS